MPAHSLSLPLAFASGLALGGLTAPAYRAALVLLSKAGADGSFDILKPDLERLAGLRLDNADRFLERIRDSHIAVPDTVAPAFDSIEYIPGVQRRLAGVVRGRLSPEIMHEIIKQRWSGQRLTLDAAELAKLSTIPGIIIWLRLAAERHAVDGDDVRLRLNEHDAVSMFGSYAGRAAITRRTKSEGEFQWTSLSRLYEQLIAPGIKDLWNAVDGHVVDARPAAPARGKGRAWAYVEITSSKLKPMTSLRELGQQSAERLRWEQRKFDKADPSKDPDAVDPADR